MRLPRDISPGTAARRALLADLLGAIGVTLVVFLLASGIGVVAVLALPTLVALLAWIAIEAMFGRVARHRRPAAPGHGNRLMHPGLFRAAQRGEPEGSSEED